MEAGRGVNRRPTAYSFRDEEHQVLPVALDLEPLDRDEADGGGVDAVAQARRLRAVVEDVAEVRVGVRRADLRAVEEVAVARLLDVVERLPEARPPGAGVVLLERAEERLAGDDVDVDPGGRRVGVLAREGRLGSGMLGDLVLDRRQLSLQLRIRRLDERGGIPGLRRGRRRRGRRRSWRARVRTVWRRSWSLLLGLARDRRPDLVEQVRRGRSSSGTSGTCRTPWGSSRRSPGGVPRPGRRRRPSRSPSGWGP